MAATTADIQRLNTTLISLMKCLDGIDQQMVEEGKNIDSLSGDLWDTMQQVRANNIAIIKLENGMTHGPTTTYDKHKRSNGLLPLPDNDPKVANNHPLHFLKMEFPIYDGEVDPLVWEYG